MTPIVLVPGLLCSSDVFAAQISALWPHGSVVVANTREQQTIPEMASRILEVAPPRFALCGISMGGYVALEVMQQMPGRVAKLALLDTTARPDSPEQTEGRRALLARARDSGDFVSFAVDALDHIMIPEHRGIAAIREINRKMAAAVGLEGFRRQTEAIIVRADARPLLPAISVPTLVLVGDRDALTPPDHAREMADAISGSTLVVVPECGHASTLEQPDAVNDALLRWIQG